MATRAFSADHSTSATTSEAIPSGERKALPSILELRAMADRVVDESFTAVPPIAGEDRHDLNSRLQKRDWSKAGAPTSAAVCHYDGSGTIVIAFEGTGAFEARLAPAVQRMTQLMLAAGVNTRSPYYGPGDMISDALRRKTGRDPHWSGLDRGILSQIMRNEELSKSTQWLSFASEEFEALSDMGTYNNKTADQLLADVVVSSNFPLRNVTQAQSCLNEMLADAHSKGKSPHLVVVSHSSGGRSAVQFAEALQKSFDPRTGGAGVKIELMYTIDPVQEAHKVIQEATRELVNKGTEHNWNRVKSLVGATANPVYPPCVGGSCQASILYKPSNVARGINFFQTIDEIGLKVVPRFGIHGSPMVGADQNTHLTTADGLGSSAHGEITHSPKVLTAFENELVTLKSLPMRSHNTSRLRTDQ